MDRYDPYGSSGLVRFLRWMSASFRVGRIAGTEIRMYWLGAVIVPLVTAIEMGKVAGSFGETLLLTLIVTVGLYVVITTHEFGHVLAGRRYGIRTPLVTLSPMGGLAHMGGSAPGPRAEAIVAATGPTTHLLWLAVLFPLKELVGWDAGFPWGWETAWIVELFFGLNVGLLVFNLLPFFPMDGGRIFRAALAARMHPNRATILAIRVGYAGAAGIFVWGLVTGSFWGGILLAIAISNFFACQQEMIAARHLPSPYSTADRMAPWQDDADAWKRGAGRERGEKPRRPGFFARRRARRREQAAARRVEEERALAGEVDRILDRVSEVGMSGLTEEERKTLLEASKRRPKS